MKIIECKNCSYNKANLTEISLEISLSETTVTNNENQIFVCYKYPKFNSKCFFYDEKTGNYTFIDRVFNCKNNIKNYYFKGISEFAVVCKNGDLLSIYKNNKNSKYSNQKFFYSSVNISKFACNNNSKNYVFYYNSSEKRYLLEYDCINNNNYNLIKYITEPKKYERNILSWRGYFINETLDDLLNHLYDFLEESIYIGNKYKIYSHDYSLYIRPIAFYENFYMDPDIDFSDCEYLITSNNNYEYLTLIIFEIYNPNNDALNNKIEYKLFDENYEEVNTNICKNINITINFTMKDIYALDYEKIEKINNFTKFNVNLFNISDVFFQELCHVYPDFEYDIILKDRVVLYEKYYVCDEGCFFKQIYEFGKYISCDCPFKTDFDITLPSFNPEEIQIPTKFPKYYEIVKCAGLVFSSDDKINNLGFYLITFMLGGHMPIWCYYLSTSVSPIKNYITKEMTKFGYISKKKGDKSSKGKKKGTKEDENNKENAENVESPPKKTDKKKKSSMINVDKKNDNKEVIIVNKGSKKKKKKTNKKGTYIHSCYIINNNNNVDNKNVKKTGKKKKSKSLKMKKKSIKLGKLDENSKDLSKNSNKSLEPHLMETQDINYLYNGDEEEENYEDFDFLHIKITPNAKQEPRKESNKILNNYTYEEAIELDKRGLCRIFYIYLLSKNIIFKTFLLKSPFDTISLLGCALIFIFSNDLFFNCLLYSDKIVSKRYHYEENVLAFTFSTNLPNVFGSLFIVYVYVIIIYLLTNMNQKIRTIFQQEEEKLKKDKKYVVTEERKKQIMDEVDKILNSQNTKNYAFFAIEIIFMLLYWYYITAFCHVYSNSQVSWVLNVVFTIVFRFIIDCLICLLFSIIYTVAVGQKSEGLYNAALFIYNI